MIQFFMHERASSRFEICDFKKPLYIVDLARNANDTRQIQSNFAYIF
jgi:hypothetical protein